ncbi:MAG: glycosyl hydrolase 53 family protein [Bacteroidales bacterium]|nr:MAG: glycosyl hydrolase 53 family protein [Bacteroidales bacterium]
MRYLSAAIIFSFSLSSFCQTFYFGNDLSYANQMEDCGAVFKENMVPKDVYQIFADHGTNLVRVRLWVDPTWQNSLEQPDGVKNQYSDFEDVRETIARSKAAGMEVLLDFHMSDFWADPGKQIIPSRWVDVATDVSALADSVYKYVADVLTALEEDTLMPELVQIGNETNSGILKHTILNPDYSAGGSVSSDWNRHAQLFNAGIQAVRDVSDTTTIKPKIVLHYAGLGMDWWFNNIIDRGVTDFDIIGFSYYYAWHGESIEYLGQVVEDMVASFPGYEVMPVECGYLWTTQNFDGMGNIITEPDPEYLPVIPEKQLEYMVDYTRSVMKAGGTGVIFWEPAWVSTPCRTPWGQGSSHDHVVFFDPDSNNFMENGGGRWTESHFYEDPDAIKVTFKVDMAGQDVSKGVYITGSWTGESWKILPMANEGLDVYSYFTYLAPGDSGAYYFLNDTLWEARESVPQECATWWDSDRGYKIGQNDTVYTFKWGSCQSGDAPSDVNVTFIVDMTGQDVSRGVYIVGQMNDWDITRMTNIGNGLYYWSTILTEGDAHAYYYLTTRTWDNYQDYRETVPDECDLSAELIGWAGDRAILVPGKDTIAAVVWGSCETVDITTDNRENIPENTGKATVEVFPNPGNDYIHVNFSALVENISVELVDLTGRVIKKLRDDNYGKEVVIEVTTIPSGLYILKVCYSNNIVFEKILLD